MYIKEVCIQNVRGFGEGERAVEIDLTRPDGSFAGWTVLAGRNGSGKTTLLKCIGLALAGPAHGPALQQSFAGWINHRAEVQSVVSVKPVFAAEEWSLASDFAIPVDFIPTLEVRLDRRTDSAEPNVRWNTTTWSKPTSDRGNWVPVFWNVTSKAFFVAGYGPYRRLTGHAADAQRLMSGPARTARLVNLFREDSSLVEGVAWLKDVYLRRLEDKPGAKELETSVLRLLQDGLLPDGMRVDKIDSDGLWVEREGFRLALTDLSDGYRAMAALVLDLVRHLADCFGDFRLVDQDGHPTVLYEGVVLIDEIEAHLHVSWQQKVGFWLKQHFPKLQFIVTTHSPFVCQAADPKGLIRLGGPGDERAARHVGDETFNRVVNGDVDEAVLSGLFGLEQSHSERSERLREKIAQLEGKLIRGEASNEDRMELERLSAQLPDTPTAAVERALRKLGADS